MVFRLGDGCKLSSNTIHSAIRYMDLVLNTVINRYDEDDDVAAPDPFYRTERYSYGYTQGYRAVSAPSHGPIITKGRCAEEYLLICLACTLMAAKYTECDENLPKLSTLQALIGR